MRLDEFTEKIVMITVAATCIAQTAKAVKTLKIILSSNERRK